MPFPLLFHSYPCARSGTEGVGNVSARSADTLAESTASRGAWTAKKWRQAPATLRYGQRDPLPSLQCRFPTVLLFASYYWPCGENTKPRLIKGKGRKDTCNEHRHVKHVKSTAAVGGNRTFKQIGEYYRCCHTYTL